MIVLTRRGRFLAACLTGAAMLLAGCAASSPSAGLAPRAAATSPPAQATTTPSAAPAACTSGALSVVLQGHPPAGAGPAHYTIEFLNISPTLCTLQGFPSVSFTGTNDSTPIGAAAARNHSGGARLVSMPPEGFAVAKISVADAGNYPSGCRPTQVSGILVHPPGLAHAVRLPVTGMTCLNRKYHVLTVTAVEQGRTPNGST